MTDLKRTTRSSITERQGLTRVAVWCAYLSGVVSIFGIIFLVAYFITSVGPLGTLNDIAVVVQYVLMLPLALALYQVLSPHRPALSRAALVVGISGMLAVIVIQVTFMSRLLPYEQYIVMVSAGFMVVLAWFLMVRHLGWSNGVLPKSVLLHVLAGLYFGYPFWAFSLARRLRAL